MLTLDTPIADMGRVGKSASPALARLGVRTVANLAAGHSASAW